MFSQWIRPILCICAILAATTVYAAEIPRKILAFYDSKSYSDVTYTPLHQHAEMPLNYLGLDVVYHDVNQPLPDASALSGVRGIVTWFIKGDSIRDPKTYCTWVQTQMDRGLKLVILGRAGFFIEGTRTMPAECQAVLQKLGVRYMGSRSDAPYFFEIVKKDPTMVEFERKLQLQEGLLYSFFKVISPKVKIYLAMRRTDIADSDSALVFTSPTGGLVYDSYVIFENKEIEKIHWRINPFKFFNEAFAASGFPRPDPTTRNGRRIFYSHIDGDGIFNVSHIDNKRYSAEVIYDEILKKTPDLPIAASIITGYLDFPAYRGAREMDLYKNIFSLPNIEPAAHGYAHPFIWAKKTLALDIPGYTYNVDKEVRGSVVLVNGLLAQLGVAKKAMLYQWTGDCVIPPEALQSVEEAGVPNMNGGDTRFDERRDSYARVYPLSIVKGGWRQVYASEPNENVYTELWKGRYYGYEEVLQTFKNTETPLRVKPINIYYHYYSGERQASLKAVTAAYAYARSQPIFPVWASEWPHLVDDFFAMRIIPEGGGFRIVHDGALRTLRFDQERRDVDVSRSQGVLGYTHVGDRLYVHLDEGREHWIGFGRGTRPYIIEANTEIRRFSWAGGRVQFEKMGWLPGEVVLGGMVPNSRYKVVAGAASVSVLSDRAGRLRLALTSSKEFQSVIIEAL